MKVISIISIALIYCLTGRGAEKISLEEALELGQQRNLSVKSKEAMAQGQEALINQQYAPSSPSIGVSELNRNVSTTYATLSQKIDFPTKYFLRGDAQSHRAQAAHHVVHQWKWNLRSEIISTYYSLYTTQKIIALTRRDLQRLKEASRTAESKYAAGKAPQHDSMRAHVAQTQTETTLIELRQQETTEQTALARLLNADPNLTIQTESELPLPNVLEYLKGRSSTTSHEVKEKRSLLDSARDSRRLAQWGYAPDIQFRYQKRIAGAPADSHIVGIEVSIPLWFWGNQSQVSAASATELAAEASLNEMILSVDTKLRQLEGQIKTDYELLTIFDTSLIPQSLTSYNSATSAYRAGKISFSDYLDTERSSLKIEIARYRTLNQYIKSVTQYEAILGKVISGLGKEPTHE